MSADWTHFNGEKSHIYGEDEPTASPMHWAREYLLRHFGVETPDEVNQELVDSGVVEYGENKKLPFPKIMEYTYNSYKEETNNILDELITILMAIQQKFIEKEFKPCETLDFEYSKGRTTAFNESILNIFAAVDPDFSIPSSKSDSALKQSFGFESPTTELELLEKIKEMVEDLVPVIDEWSDWVSINGPTNSEQVLNELFTQSKNEVVDLSRVKADVALWNISEFINLTVSGKLDIDPIYQRNDVWSTSASISLIHSILRGIPLPSVILWENASGHFQVIDGKQRISSILKFYGAHPSGFKLLESKMPQVKQYLIDKLPEKDKAMKSIIQDMPDGEIAQHILGNKNLHWPKSIKIPTIGKWKKNQHYGPTTKEEKEIATKFLPFKLNNKTKNSSVAVLRETSSKYYWEIKDQLIEDHGPTILNVFQEGSSSYKIPVIKFDKGTTPSQIRQVFKLYNSTGMKLNPTEQNNASYQNQLSLKLVLTVCNIRPERGDELYEDTDFKYPE